MPREGPCNKTYDEHETPGIRIGIPGVSYLAHSCMGALSQAMTMPIVITVVGCTVLTPMLLKLCFGGQPKAAAALPLTFGSDLKGYTAPDSRR